MNKQQSEKQTTVTTKIEITKFNKKNMIFLLDFYQGSFVTQI